MEKFNYNLEPYHRKNLFARDFYLDIVYHFPMCIGCPYLKLGCDIDCNYECELLNQVNNSLEMGY